MFTCIIGGFLGSGKTTLLMKIAGRCRRSGITVAILVNEMGEIGIDGATIKAEGYDAIELPDGCICCSLSGTLQNALKNIDRDIHPDIIIIEPTGLALPHKVKELVHISMIESDRTFIVGLADAKRFDEIVKSKEEFFKRQLHASDILLITKTDLCSKEELERITYILGTMHRGKDIIPVSAVTEEGIDETVRRILDE
ncbi:MAG: GTPase [Methanomassiliicoccaceae archaeon]|jgi:G3E family GTPase|nr:GTPase [Methanomassiliicoccaceae archaeon]